MNYLAHAFFAEDSPESIVGNLAPDFIRGERYAPTDTLVLRGMRTHRFVDEFTDEHPVFRKSCRRFSAVFRHFSGIIVDITYDHFLSKRWHQHTTLKLLQFVDRVYASLDAQQTLCPVQLRNALPRLKEQNWLGSYGEPEGVGVALDRLSKRMNRHVDFSGAVPMLLANYSDLEADFAEFFPEVRSAVNQFLVKDDD